MNIFQLKRMYRDGTPLKVICAELGIKQPHARYHLKSMGLLLPEQTRTDRVIYRAILKGLDAEAISVQTGISISTTKKHITRLKTVAILSLNPTSFNSSALVGVQRRQYNLRLFDEVFLASYFCVRCKEKITFIRSTFFGDAETNIKIAINHQMINLTPTQFLNWVRSYEIKVECECKEKNAAKR